jgi:F-type H+-transporting ATPase subunit b
MKARSGGEWRVVSGERRGRRALLFAIGVAAAILFALNAHAAEEGGNAATEKATEIFKWINFAIVAGVMVWVFGKLLPPVFRKKAEAISSAITTATSAKAAADAQLREAETRLANLEKEVVELRATAEREAAAEVARLRAATQTDAQKIAAAAKTEIEAAERAARLELKALAANLAVDGAETLLAKQLTPQAQESLISNFVKSLEGRPN